MSVNAFALAPCTTIALSPLLLSNVTLPRSSELPSTSNRADGTEVELYFAMSPTATFPVGPSTYRRPTPDHDGRVVDVSGSWRVTSPSLTARVGLGAARAR